MKNDSYNLIPSFDSIPYLSKDPGPFFNEMKLIVSKGQIDSIRSIDHDIEPNLQILEVGVDLINECDNKDQFRQSEKQIVFGTLESFKTPKKKKKTGCVCKKTGCLKLYCECFASGKNCTQECSCCNCINTNQNSLLVQSARAGRKIRSKNTPERRVCNCKKTQCLKKYCQCFNDGQACSSECRCQGCSNTEDPENKVTTNGKKLQQ